MLASIYALANWRKAVYLAILLDILRDPVRKLDDTQSVLITISVGGLWAAIFLGMWQQNQPAIRDFLNRNRSFFKSLQYVAIGLIPGILVSLFVYTSGYRLVALGITSYLAPFLGVFIGVAYSKNESDIPRLMRFYALANGLSLLSVAAEFAGVESPILGGLLNMNWIRYSGASTIELIGGIYRSPDIMGLHAAHVVIFSIYLASLKSTNRFFWILLALWGIVCLLLGGRRKMLGIPLVFVASFFVIASLNGIRKFSSLTIPLALTGIFALIGLTFFSEDSVSQEYLDYASTLFTDGIQRSNEVVIGSVFHTLDQSGIFGTGIGSATQGNYQAGAVIRGGWQEDGVSRLFRELGLPGVFMLSIGAFLLFKSIVWSIKQVKRGSDLNYLQIALLSMLCGNIASFCISHQQYSGDPSSSLLVLLLLGMALGIGYHSALRDASRSDKSFQQRVLYLSLPQQNPTP